MNNRGSPAFFRTLLSDAGESELVQRFKHGDEKTLGIMIDLYWIDLCRFAGRIVEDHDEAEDIVQEAFMRLWKGRSTWERQDSLRPVLRRIIRNLALNARRKSESLRKCHERASESPTVESPLDEVEQADLRTRVKVAVEELPRRRREVVVLVRFHQLSYREAASALDLSTQTIANHMNLAMKDLRSALEPYLRELHATEAAS